jgi:hypothetical protein
LVGTLCSVAENWLQPDYAIRQHLLEKASDSTGFSSVTLANGLDRFFRQLTRDNFVALLEQDLGHADRLDAMASSGPEERSLRASIVQGPELLVHRTSSVVPYPVIMSMLLGFLVRSAQFVNCASGASLIPRLFAHSIYEADPKLAACLEIVEWPSRTEGLEAALFPEADFITVTGSEETIAAIRGTLPIHVRLLGYPDRFSFGYVTREALSGFNSRKVVDRALDDVAAWNQLGSLSPHVFYVENGGKLSAERFAELLAEALESREQIEPRGPLNPQAAATIASRRSFYEVRAAHGPETRLWSSPGSTSWTVIYETDPLFQVSCLNRFVYVKAIANLDEALHGADAYRQKISTVGLAATEDKAEAIATRLGRWGASRICPLGQMQNPPITWRSGGRPNLTDLVTWTDWEQS